MVSPLYVCKHFIKISEIITARRPHASTARDAIWRAGVRDTIRYTMQGTSFVGKIRRHVIP